MEKLGISLGVIIVSIIVLAEFDRRYGEPATLKAYYYDQPMRFVLGLYNCLLRIPSFNHPAIIYNVDAVFPSSKLLRNNYETIRDEILNVHSRYKLRNFHDISSAFNEISDGNWKVFIVKWYADPVKQAELLTPKTVEIVNKIPNLRACMFSILQPFTTIPPHKGPYKGSLRYHLGLSVPDDTKNCFINVDGDNYSWKNGEDIVFDDTYRHYVCNNTNQTRIILFCDFDRPMIEPFNTFNRSLNDSSTIAGWIRDINNEAEVPISLK